MFKNDGTILKTNSLASMVETVDTSKLKIIAPLFNSSYQYDSIITVGVNIKDTNSFIGFRVIFQGIIYSSASKSNHQIFDIFKINPILRGRNVIIASALYDSTGTTIIYTDSVSVEVLTDSLLKDFEIEPNAVVLNPSQFYYPKILTSYDRQIGYLHYSDTGVTIMADSNVVQVD